MPKAKEERKLSSTSSVGKRYISQTKKHAWLFGFAVFGVLLQQAASIVMPLYMRQFINIVASATPSAAHAALALAPLLGYLIANLVQWTGSRMEMGFGVRLIAHASEELRQEAFEYLMRHSHSFFSSNFTGALTRRISRYSDSYERLYYSFQTTLLPASIYIMGAAVVLFERNAWLGIITLVWVVLFVGIQWMMIRYQQPLRLKRSEEDSNVTAIVADAVSNQNTIMLFAGNDHEEALLGGASGKLLNAILKLWSFDVVFYGLQSLMAIAANVGLLYAALYFWQKGVLTVGDLVLVQAYVFGILSYTWGIGREFRVIYTSIADAAEMVYILETPHEINDKRKAKKLAVRDADIRFENVDFDFHKGTSILRQFNMDIKGGERIALVGPSGAGKSTITKLLLRFYSIKGGSITIDGQNIADVTQDSLRIAIGFVPQEPILFHRTLMDNIRYGRRDATDAEVIEAAKLAHCHEFIDGLPEKYHTYVGERGIKLSGGERQRVAIARAILKNAPILVLDEATSSLDSESEHLIQQALDVLMRGKTVIVIAHRLSTIMKMDRIVVIEGGKVVANGTHQELLGQEGLYKKLWSIQAGGFIAGDVDDTKDKLEEDIVEEIGELTQE